MKCRQCRHPETKVLESRESKDGSTIRRRRECQSCGFRFTTFERSEEQPVYVVKRDGTRELFDRQKLLRSMVLASQKRNVSPKELESVAEWVERTAGMSDEKEISTARVGELVLDVLRHLDPVAYVRFASVYRSFEGPDDFVSELERLAQNAKSFRPASEEPDVPEQQDSLPEAPL
ncbi:MAG: transcriptional repressor NrdR [Silvanigrellales bacterium]|jgi:transcriptional repressor NrdR|nr:transcriptional repressor NrdR [Silvanigrellales bacterium]